MEIKGKIIQILPIMEGVSKNGNPWKVQPFVLETLDQYPRKVYFEIFGEERIAQCPLDINYEVTVHFDAESREFKGRWYTQLRAWKITTGQDEEAPVDAEQAGETTSVTAVPSPVSAAQEEDPEAGPFGSVNAGTTLPF